MSRSRPRLGAGVVGAALLSLAAPVGAHVAPSVDTNNRYLSVTPMADRVRLAYTVLIGAAPGRVARHALDRDRDGQVSEAEAAVWGQDLAARIRGALVVTLDGREVPVTWATVYVGMDDRGIDAGAFSLDLIAWLCLPGGGDHHRLDLVDPFPLTPPGETEVKIADEPGVRVEVSDLGANPMAGRIARTQGVAAPLTDGLHVVYTVTDARPLADGRCPRAPDATKATSRWPWLLALVAAAVALGLVLRRRRSLRN